MSESDSDFAYESADEDSVPNNDEQRRCEPDSLASPLPTKEMKSTEGENNLEDLTRSSVEKASKSQVENMSSTLQKSVVSTEAAYEEGSSKILEVPHTNIASASDISCSKHDDASLPKAEPKRVKLRLEKKLQERDKMVSNREVDSSNIGDFGDDSAQELIVEEKQQSWGWGSWGTSLLSSAASSVSTFTSQVSQGFEAVIETVESTLGAPAPEELAATVAKKEKLLYTNHIDSEVVTTCEMTEGDNDNSASGTGLLGGVTSLTKALENTSAKVIMGGLDTLELIGKKTIDILTEGDPGLRKKRAAFSENINLSQVLRDARNRAEEMSSGGIGTKEEDTINYSTFFDEFQGLIHLEVLEMLSEQSQCKVQNLSLMLTDDVEKKCSLDQIRTICESITTSDDTSDEEMEQDFIKVIMEHTDALQLPVKPEKLLQVQASVSSWHEDCFIQQSEGKSQEPKVLYSKAISSLAEFTAKSIEQFHKIAELILVQSDLPNNILHYTTHLAGFASALSIEVGIMSSKFCNYLNTIADESEDPDKVTSLITSVYLEATNSTTYIQDAFQLLIPILQLAELK